jgi:hypothetical protein
LGPQEAVAARISARAIILMVVIPKTGEFEPLFYQKEPAGSPFGHQ